MLRADEYLSEARRIRAQATDANKYEDRCELAKIAMVYEALARQAERFDTGR